jgi:hypothetical protein
MIENTRIIYIKVCTNKLIYIRECTLEYTLSFLFHGLGLDHLCGDLTLARRGVVEGA